MVTQNKMLHFSKCVKWITIFYGEIPQQVLGSVSLQKLQDFKNLSKPISTKRELASQT